MRATCGYIWRTLPKVLFLFSQVVTDSRHWLEVVRSGGSNQAALLNQNVSLARGVASCSEDAVLDQ